MHKTRLVATAVLTAAAMLTSAMPTLAQTAPAAVVAAQAGNPFKDVPTNHWAYQAIQQLAADGLINGYPGGTFRGNRPLTRYEMAVLVDRAVNAVERKMTTGAAVKPSDLAAVRRLVDEFGSELKDVQNRVAALNRRVDALGRTEAATSARMAGARPGFAMWVRPTTFSEKLSAVNGPTTTGRPGGQIPNAAVTSGTVTFSPGHGGTSLNTIPVTPIANGGIWQAARFMLNGKIDPRWSYQFRIEQQMFGERPLNGQTTTNPSFCTTAACSPSAGAQDYPGNAPLRLNYADIVYTAPSGVYAKVGRVTTDSGIYNSSGLMFGGGQDNGLMVGYTDKRWNAWTMVAYNQSSATLASEFAPSATNCPLGVVPARCVTQNAIGFLGKADYWIPQLKLDIGGSYNRWNGIVNTSWNPIAGLCTSAPGSAVAATTTLNAFTVPCPAGTTIVRVTAPTAAAVLGAPVTGAYQSVQTNISAGSLFAAHLFGNKARPQFKAVVEGEMRFGIDPLTGQAWNGNKAFYGELDFASKGNLTRGPLIPSTGIRNSNVVQFDYYNIGLNGTGVEGGPYGSATWQSFYFGNQNGFQNYLLMFDHWFTNNVRAGIGFQHWNLQNGITIPAGSVTCPGCYVTGVNANAVFLDTWMFF